MSLGFTGTRRGCTEAQAARLAAWLTGFEPSGDSGELPTFRHGGCVGADRQFHSLVRDLWGIGARLVVHPMLAAAEVCDWYDADELLEPRDNRTRNAALVRASTLMLACPGGAEDAPDQLRSGTWQTVRLARAAGVPVVVFWPHGGMG